FKGSEYSERAEAFSSKVMDVSVYLAKLDLVRPGKSEQKIRVGYHDACHLAHAQQVRSAPRRMLSGIENLELVEIADSETCCGSAGTYNIDQPELAAQLGKRKADVVLKSGCQVLAAGNIGCLVQIEKHLLASGAKIPVMHPIEILDRVYRGDAVVR
ncbi:MAG: (Fe-S)-binding protein, partial [Planctomycetota bacterium]|nr:(Fe-S)-binding protein [Planctomycetota bacterium]